MNLLFRDRIALYNTAAAAVVTLLVFISVYIVVYISAYRHLDANISLEKEEVFNNVNWESDTLIVNMTSERLEIEHQQDEVSPTFLQIVDADGALIFRSANLRDGHLKFAQALTEPAFFNIEFNGKLIRQGQFPMINDKGKVLGQLAIGLPQVESVLILKNLRLTLFIAFPLVLIIFYLVTSWAASRGIAPVHQLIRETGRVSEYNISSRIPLPSRKDEIYLLGNTINDLLGRLEVSLTHEKQITADISHELRTPVTSIRGTLEVLIRKIREPHQYEEKIIQVIHQVDALNKIIDNLLQLSRLDAGNLTINKSPVELEFLLDKIKERWRPSLIEKNCLLLIRIDKDVRVNADAGFLEIMLENLISNAVKYGGKEQQIVCAWDEKGNKLSITDNGPGIPREQLPYLFNRFYRTDASRSSEVQGNGLGLSIVKTLADLQHIHITVQSEVNSGTTFTLHFNSLI
jgi:two-component system heavy metal sensor histidine kinase CusS